MGENPDQLALAQGHGAVDRAYGPASEVFAALASPVRAAIVHRLTEQPQTVTDLVDHLGASQPLVSRPG